MKGAILVVFQVPYVISKVSPCDIRLNTCCVSSRRTESSGRNVHAHGFHDSTPLLPFFFFHVTNFAKKCHNLTHFAPYSLVTNALHCVRLCVRFLFLRDIFWQMANREKQSALNYMNLALLDRAHGTRVSAGFHCWYFYVPQLVLLCTTTGTRLYHCWYKHTCSVLVRPA